MSDTIPGKTLHQPYAGLVRLGLKTIETRKARTHHRGPMVFCAAQVADGDAMLRLRGELVPERVSVEEFDAACGLRGVIVAIAKVVDCRPLTREDYERALFFPEDGSTRWAWVLDDVRPVVPRPWRGCQGISRVPVSILEVS